MHKKLNIMLVLNCKNDKTGEEFEHCRYLKITRKDQKGFDNDGKNKDEFDYIFEKKDQVCFVLIDKKMFKKAADYKFIVLSLIAFICSIGYVAVR